MIDEADARRSLLDKGILGPEQDAWIEKYIKAGKVRAAPLPKHHQETIQTLGHE